MLVYHYKQFDFYRYNDLKEVNHPCLKRTNRGIIAFCEQANMVEGEDYLYARYKENKGWRRTLKANYLRRLDKIFLSKKWADGFKRRGSEAPEILHLEDHERFRDDEGNVYDVEVRGERHHQKCFFKAKDVAECFGLTNLLDSLLHPTSAYLKDEDYVWFYVGKSENTRKISGKEEIYLTYLGLMRAMIVSRTGYARRFLKWAAETLFTVHLGTNYQKNKLAAKLTGADYATVKAFCNVVNTKISMIYLFRIGIVKDLRDMLNIPQSYPDNAIVCKYGRTNDIRRRFSEHIRNKYSQKYGFQTTLLTAWFVDNERSTSAENNLKAYLDDGGIRLENPIHTEIAIFGIKEHLIAPLLNPLFSKYSKEIKSLEETVQKLEAQIDAIEKDHQFELQEMKNKHNLEMQSAKSEQHISSIVMDNDIKLLKQDVSHLREMLTQKDIIIKLLGDVQQVN